MQRRAGPDSLLSRQTYRVPPREAQHPAKDHTSASTSQLSLRATGSLLLAEADLRNQPRRRHMVRYAGAQSDAE
ncbi:hypothetical protein KCU81_g520, partial [Aureobasidium melanogenum]